MVANESINHVSKRFFCSPTTKTKDDKTMISFLERYHAKVAASEDGDNE